MDIVNKKAETRQRYFEKTVCLLTADGSLDDKIHPQSVDDFVFKRAASDDKDKAEAKDGTDEKVEQKADKADEKQADANDDGEEEEDDDVLFDDDDDGELDADIKPQTLKDVMPKEGRVVAAAPALNRKLKGRKIIYKFDYGWFVGRIRKVGKRGEFNAEVDYGAGPRDQFLDVKLYGSAESAPVSSWILLER